MAATFLPKHRFIVKSWDMETACKKLSVAVRGFRPGSSTAISSTAVFVYFRFIYSILFRLLINIWISITVRLVSIHQIRDNTNPTNLTGSNGVSMQR